MQIAAQLRGAGVGEAAGQPQVRGTQGVFLTRQESGGPQSMVSQEGAGSIRQTGRTTASEAVVY